MQLGNGAGVRTATSKPPRRLPLAPTSLLGKTYLGTIDLRWITGDRPSGDVMALLYAALSSGPSSFA